MNIRRGLFRLWIVLSTLFVIPVAWIASEDVKPGFEAAALVDRIEKGDFSLPMLCGDAKGAAGTDYTLREGQRPGPWDTVHPPNPFDNCWYALPKFRQLYPEHSARTNLELTNYLRDRAGYPLVSETNPWPALVPWIGVALGVPLAVLSIGAALYWALAGFASHSRPRQPKA